MLASPIVYMCMYKHMDEHVRTCEHRAISALVLEGHVCTTFLNMYLSSRGWNSGPHAFIRTIVLAVLQCRLAGPAVLQLM